MSNVFHNMSAPPKSKVSYEIKPLSNKYYLLSPKYVFDELKINSNNFNKFIEYVENHQELKKPKNFIFVKQFNSQKLLEQTLGNLTNLDINLSISILARISGNLYIPNRDPYIDEEIMNSIYVVSQEDIENV